MYQERLFLKERNKSLPPPGGSSSLEALYFLAEKGLAVLYLVSTFSDMIRPKAAELPEGTVVERTMKNDSGGEGRGYRSP